MVGRCIVDSGRPVCCSGRQYKGRSGSGHKLMNSSGRVILVFVGVGDVGVKFCLVCFVLDLEEAGRRLVGCDSGGLRLFRSVMVI